MTAALFGLLSGLLFGLGLVASGMSNPAKVKGFLDLAGAWDPSLALVMGGAIAVAVFAFALAQRLPRSWSGASFDLPTSRRIDARLVAGGLLFGAGWGIAGFCPGPALVALASAGNIAGDAALFVLAMLAGMLLHDEVWARRSGAIAPASTDA